MKTRFLLIMLALLLSCQLIAQIGQPLLHNYTYRDYRTHPIMWSAVQDKEGVLYFANNDGVVTFDGARWSLISVPNSVRAVALDSNRQVYVGCIGDFGALVPNTSGNITFKSFKQFLSAKDKGTYDVDRVYLSGKDDVLFLSETEGGSRLIRVKNQKSIKVFTLSGVYGSGQAFGTVYINEIEKGLMQFSSDKLNFVPGGAIFGDKEIVAIREMPNGNTLIATYDNGLYVKQGNSFQQLSTGADGFLMEKKCYDATVLPSGNIVVATKDNGAVLLSGSGQVIRYFNTDTGMPSMNMYFSFSDREGGVWLAHSRGMSHYLPEIPVSTLENIGGLSGKITSMSMYNGRLYVATITGVYSINPNGGGTFEPVAGISNECRSLIQAGGSLLVVSKAGVFDISSGSAQNILSDENPNILFTSVKNPGVVYVGLKKGVAILKNTGGWTSIGRIQRVTENITSIEEDADGSLWLGTAYQALLKVNNPTSSATIKKYGEKDGLSDGFVHVQKLGNETLFETAEGVFILSGEKFVLNPQYSRLFGGKANRFYVGEDGKVWIISIDKVQVGEKSGEGSFKIDSTTFANIANDRVDFLLATKENTWIAYNDKIIRINNQNQGTKRPFQAVIRSVKAGEDSTLFSGFYWDENKNFSLKQTKNLTPDLSFTLNSVTIDVGATSFLNASANEYQFWLEGADEGWSNWQKQSTITYNSLREGSYTLKVRAKNALGEVSQVATYQFSVNPPFYRNPIAYLLYAVLGIGLVYGAVRLNARRLEKRNKELEVIVTERTREVNEQNKVLGEQKITLEQKNVEINKAYEDLKNTQDQLVQSEKMAALGQLIANIAHEINTPIGAINGASNNINKTLPATLASFPAFFKKLTPELEASFFQLVDKSLGFSGALSSREERQYTKDVKSFLEEKGLNEAANSAKDLVKIGVFDDLDKFTPLFQQPNVSEIIDMASTIGKIRVNLDNIGLAVQKTQKIVYALKTYSHKSVGEEKTPCSVVNTVETVLTLYSNQLKSGIDLTTHFDRSLPDIMGYPDELHQVWTNIIHNAIQAMDNKGSLDVQVYKEGNNIAVSITDSGPGIPDHVLPKIFDPFFTTKAAGEGSGLGLDICSKIINKHDGKIDVDTKPGRTQFIVTFPIQKA